MRISREETLADCYRLLEQTGDLEACFRRYPELRADLEADLLLHEKLASFAPPAPLGEAAGRRLLLGQLAVRNEALQSRGVLGFRPLRLAGLAAGLALLGASVVGAGASPNIPSVVGGLPEQALQQIEKVSRGKPATVPPAHSQGSKPNQTVAPDVVLPQQVGEGEHGASVSDAVREAIDGTDPGPERGQAVAQAACEAAHDRSTLPTPAQQAPGLENKPEKEPCLFENQGTPTVPASGTPPADRPSVTPGAGGPPLGVPPANPGLDNKPASPAQAQPTLTPGSNPTGRPNR
jgi:hypothetical protein